jgi:hypothetical protein
MKRLDAKKTIYIYRQSDNENKIEKKNKRICKRFDGNTGV